MLHWAPPGADGVEGGGGGDLAEAKPADVEEGAENP